MARGAALSAVAWAPRACVRRLARRVVLAGLGSLGSLGSWGALGVLGAGPCLAQLPCAVELRIAPGPSGFPGGPLEARLALGPDLSDVELAAVACAFTRFTPGGPREPLQVDIERTEDGAPRALRLAWVAAPIAADAVVTLAVALGGADVDDDGGPRFSVHAGSSGAHAEGENADLADAGATDPAAAADPTRAVVVRYGDAPCAAFVHGYDPARHADTFRTFHHLAGLHGEGWITKGAGGAYPHQRGLFVGWDRVLVGNQRHDLWTIDEALRPRQVHDSFDERAARLGPWRARHASLGRWLGNGGVKLCDERRTLEVWRPTAGALFVDHETSLTPRVTTTLSGNPAHAGVHVRLAEELFGAGAQASYLWPADASPHPYDGDTRTARWCAARFRVGARAYTLAQLVHPDNAAAALQPPAFNSRGYGRFGAFTEHRVERGATLVLRHRLVLFESPQAGANGAAATGPAALGPEAQIEALWRAWSEPPPVTVRRLK